MSRQPISVDEVDPATAYQLLESNPGTALVDVRTRAEWAFVGLPDLSEIGREVLPVEWVGFPTMTQNPAFLDELEARLGGRMPDRLFFICRSGQRSMAAAEAVAAGWGDRERPVHCTNIAEGFEGVLDAEGHRGRLNGWKARGLPWRQN